MLTPRELINRIAQLVPPLRTHRHRYYGVVAPNSPLRASPRHAGHRCVTTCGAQESQEQCQGVEAEQYWDLANQSPSDYPDDQRTD